MNALPATTTDLETARRHMDEWGYCILADVIPPDELAAVRHRFMEQTAGEESRGIAYHLPDKKQLVKFLLNKGQAFIDLLFKQQVRDMIAHVLGPAYLLSSYNGHIAHPGGSTAFHTDQFWMPQPVTPGQSTTVKPGAITRSKNRGHHVGDDTAMDMPAIAPAFVCNAMWMLDDFTPENGATIVVPGSHLSGRQPDHDLDDNANWVAATGHAGSVILFEGRTWHSTGVNYSNDTRIGLTTNFCAPQFRQQENFLLGTSPEVLDNASDDLLNLIGFKPWQGYGGYESYYETVQRGQYAQGELSPLEA